MPSALENLIQSTALTNPSCPALCRASTSCFSRAKKDVDGRVKPGHDEEPYSAALRNSAFSTRTAQNLNSGILPNGSSAGLVRRLAAASA